MIEHEIAISEMKENVKAKFNKCIKLSNLPQTQLHNSGLVIRSFCLINVLLVESPLSEVLHGSSINDLHFVGVGTSELSNAGQDRDGDPDRNLLYGCWRHINKTTEEEDFKAPFRFFIDKNGFKVNSKNDPV
uniref:Uncharacterized protein n=1 Tax=Romanomermis culicivorax TaxID=13658 RepID=A0A915HFW5_ROMCU